MITSPSALQFKFAANTAGKDKNWDFNLLATRYKDRQGTIEDVKRHVSNGHALCAGLLGGKRRSKANVIGSQWLLLDIDNSSVQKDESGQPIKGEDGKAIKIYDPQLTLDAALAHPFIQKHCALIYTTASHRPDWHKFRLVFLLPEYVAGADVVEACTRFLMQHLPHDPACKDAARVFYGNSKAEFPLVQPNATLPLDWVRQARETAQKERIEHAEQVRQIEERQRQARERAETEGWDTDALIQQALSFIPPRSLGSGNYQECLHVLMALYACYGAEAEVLAESWSPSIKGSTWNVRQKIRSFRGGRTKGITIGTLFHIAKQYGFKFPKREFTTYADTHHADVEFYSRRAEEFEEWEENCDRHTELQQQESFKSFFSNRLEKLKKFLSRTRPFKGFGQPAVAQNKRGDEVVEFTQNEHIATIQTLAQQAAAENRQLIVLDASEGGTGKSHLAGELTPQALGVNTIFYTSPNHRNPTVASIEQNYTDLPVRHDGLVSDSSQLTPLGSPYVRWAKSGEEPNVAGNCSKAHLFQTFGAKGYQEVSTEAAINPICNTCKWKSNCAGAEGLPTIPRHTFRQERRNALASDRIRCNLDSLPDIAKMQGNPEDEKEQTRVAVVVDEFTQFRGYSETQANLSDFDNAWMYFKSQVHKAESKIRQMREQQEVLQAQVNAKLAESEALETQLEAITAQQHLDLGRLTQSDNAQTVQQLESEIARLDAESGELIESVLQVSAEIDAIRKNTELLPGAIAALEPIVFALRAILNGEHEVTSVTRYGWDEAAVRGLLGDLTGLEQHLAVIRAFNPKLAALLHESDSVTLDGMSTDDRRGSARVLKVARKAMQREADKENREAIANMPSNCVVPLLEILLGEKQGSFRVNFKDLIIFTRNDRHRDQLKQADFTLILDGTKTRESLAQDLGVDPTEIVVIRQKRSGHANLKITQVGGMGLLGRDRSESMNQRVKALTNRIQQQHGGLGNVGIIDHAACIADTPQESESGYWFNDNRGSNRFKDKTALLTFGSPFPNIGQLQLEYTTLTGDRNPDKDNAQFAAFVQDRVQSEVAQSGWRLRSSRREGEHLTWYVVSDQDLSYLREYFPDAEFEVKAAFQITPNAGSLGEQTYWAVLQASKQLIESGKELTTRALAQIVGCNRSRISQIAKDVAGGFEAFRRVLMFLLKSLYRTTNTPRTAQCGEEEVLSEEEVFAAKTYLPLVLEENVQTPDDGVKQILESAESFGKESFERVLRALSFKDKAQLLGQMLTLLPQDWQQEFLDLGRELQPEVTNAI